MKIYYQWNPGSYMHTASVEVAKWLNIDIESIEGKPDFQEVWDNISPDGIAVLAIENSYMWSIHPNLQGFLKYDYQIIGDYHLAVNHCLCSKETDISKVTQAYSQMPALEQCHNYLKEKNIKPITYSDTALSASLVSQNWVPWDAAICSELAAEMYGLNILDRNIQDHQGNTTRFAIILPRNVNISYTPKSNKVTILFEAKHIPASLYKCLGVFATSGINLTKIESLPSYKWEFSAMFWIDIEWKLEDENIKNALEELKNYTTEIRILWEY